MRRVFCEMDSQNRREPDSRARALLPANLPRTADFIEYQTQFGFRPPAELGNSSRLMIRFRGPSLP